MKGYIKALLGETRNETQNLSILIPRQDGIKYRRYEQLRETKAVN